VHLWRTSKGDGVPLVRALTAIRDLKGSNEEQDHGIVIAMRAMWPRRSSPLPAKRRQRVGRSLCDNARCAGYAFAASLRDLLGRSLCAFAASLRDLLGRSLCDNARCAGYAFAASLRDLLGRSLCDNDSGLAFAGSSTCVLDPRVRPPWRAATLNF